MRPLLLVALLASVGLSAQPVRPDWDVVGYRALDEPTFEAIALQLDAEAGAPDDRPRRSPGHRLVLIELAALPLVAGEAVNGSASAVRNRWGWCVDAHGRGGECRALLDDFHARRTVGRLFLATGVVATAHVVSSERLDATETTALLAASLMSAKVAYDLGYNLEDGRAVWYEGTVAESDQLARRVGEEVVFVATAAGLVALRYLAYRALR